MGGVVTLCTIKAQLGNKHSKVKFTVFLVLRVTKIQF